MIDEAAVARIMLAKMKGEPVRYRPSTFPEHLYPPPWDTCANCGRTYRQHDTDRPYTRGILCQPKDIDKALADWTQQ